MYKIKKCIFPMIGVVSLPLVTAVVMSSSAISNSADKGMISFNGRVFKNEEEALIYLVKNNLIKISNKQVLGDVSKSYANSETGLLNKDLLPDYDTSKIHFAYFNAGRGIVKSRVEAKNTYFNPGTLTSIFDDGFGNKFSLERDAINSMRSNSVNMKVGFYNVEKIISNESNITTKMVKINPFNSKDIESYKGNIKEKLFKIIANMISNKSNKIFNISNVKLNSKASIEETKGINALDLVKKTLDKNNKNNWKIKDGVLKNNESFKTIVNWRSDWKIIGDRIKNDSKEFSWGVKGIRFRIANYGTKWKWMNINQEMSFDEYMKFLKPGKNPMNIIGTSSFNRAEFDNTGKDIIDKLKSNVLTNLDKNSLISKSNVLSRNEAINKVMWEKNEQLIKNKMNDFIKSDSNNISLKSVENLSPSERTSGLAGWFNESKIKSQDYNVQAQKNININLNDKYIDIFSQASKGLKQLMNWTKNDKTISFTLGKGEDKLFDITLEINEKGSPFVKNIEISSENKAQIPRPTQEEKERFSKSEIVGEGVSIPPEMIQKYLYWLLIKIRDSVFDIEKNTKINPTQKRSMISEVYKEYLGNPNKNFGKLKKNSGFQQEFEFNNDSRGSNKVKTIERKDAMLMQVKILSKTYDIYKNKPELLRLISKQLPNPENAIILHNKQTIWKNNDVVQDGKDNQSKLQLGEYVMKSTQDFNGSLWGEALNNQETLGITAPSWNSVRNNSKFIPAHLLLAFDNNGKQVNSGGWNYDGSTLLKFNILQNVDPQRDFDHIFVDGISGPIANMSSTIHELTINDQKIYFSKFINLKTYMLKYIKMNSIKF